jgi:AcrR family transcriptional regulator
LEQKTDKRALASEATQTRLLDAAERLFAEHGLDGVSVRSIAAAAQADVAMINYHFGSKAGLFRAVFHRRADRLNAMRLQALGSALPRSRGRPDLERVIYALAAPNIYLRHLPHMGGLEFGRIVVREMTDPKAQGRGLISETFDPIVEKFMAALSEALPGAPSAALHWAYHFAIGTLIQTMASTGRLEKLSKGACSFNDPEEVLSYLVPFITHGMAGCVRQAGPRKARKPAVRKKTKAPVRRRAATSVS